MDADQSVFNVDPDGTVSFRYRNHRGEVSLRHVELGLHGAVQGKDATRGHLFLGSTACHPEVQWLLEAFDLDRMDVRTFALKDILVPSGHRQGP